MVPNHLNIIILGPSKGGAAGNSTTNSTGGGAGGKGTGNAGGSAGGKGKQHKKLKKSSALLSLKGVEFELSGKGRLVNKEVDFDIVVSWLVLFVWLSGLSALFQ